MEVADKVNTASGAANGAIGTGDAVAVANGLNGAAVAATDATTDEHAIVPKEIAMPESARELHVLIRRYRELYVHGEDKAEQLGLLHLLRKIDMQEEAFENDCEDVEKLWAENSEPVDVPLLQRQLAGFQLLSKDLDLPTDLQLELDSAAIEEAEAEAEAATNAKSSTSTSTSTLTIPYANYNTKAEFLGVASTKPVPDASIDTVGTEAAEMQLLTKIQTRVAELEQLPSSLGSYDTTDLTNDLERANDEVIDGVDKLKVRALVELKALRLLQHQKFVRAQFLNVYTNNLIYQKPLNRYSVFRTYKRTYAVREKQKVAQTARLAEQLQEQQKREQREQLVRQTRTRMHERQEVIDEVHNDLLERKSLRLNLGKAIHHMHMQSEREESRRMEKTAKQRLQALKANDEEAYIKLLDETKDQRITHLLKQTNSFLDSLSSAVQVQQQEARMMEKADKGESSTATPVPADTSALIEPPAVTDADREKIDYYEVAHRIKEPITGQPDILVGGKLKEYQIKGLEWMVSLYNNHLNGILADEMGLGKTIQSIALITHLIEKKQETGKFLVIVPLSTITNWTMEFERWAPSVKKVVYKGSQQQRKALTYQVRAGDFTVLLTTYEYVIRDRPMFAKFKWAHMIIDEGHRLKNTHSKLFQTLTTYYHTRNRLILTGTPLQNSLPELWALLNFILPKVFNSVKSFDEWFNTPFANTGHQEKLELSEEESLLVIRRLHKVLRPFLLRRLKKDVEKDLPNKVEKVIKCKLSALQSRVYKQLLDHNALFVGSGTVGANKSGLRGLNNKVMQLRKVCNHPFVFEEVENIVNPSRLTTDLIWRSSGKFELLDRIMPKLKASGHRTLMFFQMTQVMDIMEDFLRMREIQYMRLDGSTKADDRQDMLKMFNAPDSPYSCFLLSTRAGGLGLNLQSADTVIIFDTDWNPHQDLQAQDRAHRIGQKHEVRIYRLIDEDSVEEVILERAHQKLDIDGKVIQAGKFDNKSSAEEQEAFLKRLIESEKHKDDESEMDEMDDEEMNEILARNDEEKALFAKMDAERHELEKGGPPRLMTDEELPEVFKTDVKKQLEPTEDLSDRRRHKRVFYDDGLTEEQWLQAIDDDDDTVEAAAERKRASLKRRRQRKSLRDDDSSDEGEESSDADYNGGGRRSSRNKKRRRRGRAKPKLEESDEDDESEPEGDDYDDDDAGAGNNSFAEPDEEPFVKPSLALLDELTKLKDEEGRNSAELFMVLPKRKLYPDYYKLIKKPVSIHELQQRLKHNKYDSFGQFKDDLHTMFENAKTYNQEGSLVYNDAVQMETYADSAVTKLESTL